MLAMVSKMKRMIVEITSHAVQMKTVMAAQATQTTWDIHVHATHTMLETQTHASQSHENHPQPLH